MLFPTEETEANCPTLTGHTTRKWQADSNSTLQHSLGEQVPGVRLGPPRHYYAPGCPDSSIVRLEGATMEGTGLQLLTNLNLNPGSANCVTFGTSLLFSESWFYRQNEDNTPYSEISFQD